LARRGKGDGEKERREEQAKNRVNGRGGEKNWGSRTLAEKRGIGGNHQGRKKLGANRRPKEENGLSGKGEEEKKSSSDRPKLLSRMPFSETPHR